MYLRKLNPDRAALRLEIMFLKAMMASRAKTHLREGRVGSSSKVAMSIFAISLLILVLFALNEALESIISLRGGTVSKILRSLFRARSSMILEDTVLGGCPEFRYSGQTH
jgi:hypothetical protein